MSSSVHRTWILLKLISLHAELSSDTSLMISSTLASLGSGSGYFVSLVASQWSWYVTPRMSAISLMSSKVASSKNLSYSACSSGEMFDASVADSEFASCGCANKLASSNF